MECGGQFVQVMGARVSQCMECGGQFVQVMGGLGDHMWTFRSAHPRKNNFSAALETGARSK